MSNGRDAVTNQEISRDVIDNQERIVADFTFGLIGDEVDDGQSSTDAQSISTFSAHTPAAAAATSLVAAQGTSGAASPTTQPSATSLGTNTDPFTQNGNPDNGANTSRAPNTSSATSLGGTESQVTPSSVFTLGAIQGSSETNAILSDQPNILSIQNTTDGHASRADEFSLVENAAAASLAAAAASASAAAAAAAAVTPASAPTITLLVSSSLRNASATNQVVPTSHSHIIHGTKKGKKRKHFESNVDDDRNDVLRPKRLKSKSTVSLEKAYEIINSNPRFFLRVQLLEAYDALKNTVDKMLNNNLVQKTSTLQTGARASSTLASQTSTSQQEASSNAAVEDGVLQAQTSALNTEIDRHNNIFKILKLIENQSKNLGFWQTQTMGSTIKGGRIFGNHRIPTGMAEIFTRLKEWKSNTSLHSCRDSSVRITKTIGSRLSSFFFGCSSEQVTLTKTTRKPEELLVIFAEEAKARLQTFGIGRSSLVDQWYQAIAKLAEIDDNKKVERFASNNKLDEIIKELEAVATKVAAKEQENKTLIQYSWQ